MLKAGDTAGLFFGQRTHLGRINADDRLNVVRIERGKRGAQDRVLCKTPLGDCWFDADSLYCVSRVKCV